MKDNIERIYRKLEECKNCSKSKTCKVKLLASYAFQVGHDQFVKETCDEQLPSHIQYIYTNCKDWLLIM